MAVAITTIIGIATLYELCAAGTRRTDEEQQNSTNNNNEIKNGKKQEKSSLDKVKGKERDDEMSNWWVSILKKLMRNMKYI